MAAFCADRLLRIMISSSGEGRLGFIGHAARDTRDTSVLLDGVVLPRDNMASIDS